MQLETKITHQSTHLKVVLNDCSEKLVNTMRESLLHQLGWEDLLGSRLEVIGPITQRQMGEHDYDEPWTELNLEIIAQNLQFADPCSVVLQATSKQIFMEDCIAAHMFLPLEAFHFGSLFKGRFLSHFSRAAYMGTAVDQFHSLRILQILRNCPTIVDPMFVDFEHDRDIFTVRFAILDGGFRPKINENRGDNRTLCGSIIPGSAIALKVRYTSIRRILVDLRAKLPNGTYCRRIYFHLNYPPEIRKYQKKPDDDEDRAGSDGNRWRTIPENNDDRRDNCAAINESPYFCLQLRQQVPVIVELCILEIQYSPIFVILRHFIYQ
uniref:PH-like domain-containing protein n=1 Tax=Setaria digitata TaxID=48799 RepID=A0A915Q3J5_9BILA